MRKRAVALIFASTARRETWATTAKVLKRDEWARWQQAAGIQQLAGERLGQLDAELSEARRQGMEAGHAAGRLEGRRAGLAEVLDALHSEHVFVERLNGRLAGLVEDVVRGLLVEIHDPAWFRRRVGALLAKAGECKVVRLRVAPSQVDAAQAALAQTAAAGEAVWIRVEADAALADADVVIEADSAIFDGRIGEQVAAVRDLLLDALRRPGSSAADAGALSGPGALHEQR
jgi:flagellar biosynthesis/type III secretory pathway protein FliH